MHRGCGRERVFKGDAAAGQAGQIWRRHAVGIVKPQRSGAEFVDVEQDNVRPVRRGLRGGPCRSLEKAAAGQIRAPFEDTCILPPKLECQLDIARGIGSLNLADQRTRKCRDRIGEVRVIEDIEELRAKLDLDWFA